MNMQSPTTLDERLWAAEARIQQMTKALESIANNTCCDRCQEAALVARAALPAQGGDNDAANPSFARDE